MLSSSTLFFIWIIILRVVAEETTTSTTSPFTTNPPDDKPEGKDSGLLGRIEPNLKAVKGLICYQCRSKSSEQTPLCDKSIFRLTTPHEKYNMSLQCPHYQGDFCFIQTITKGQETETLRGCTGAKDKNGHLMKRGCMFKKNEVLCLSDKKFCNKSIIERSLLEKQLWLIFAVVATLLNLKNVIL